MKEVWVVRHGHNILEEDVKEHGVWQKDSPLSEEGKVHLLGVRERHIVGVDFQIARHSPFLRAVETAHILLPEADWWFEDNMLATFNLEELDEVYRGSGNPPQTLTEVEHLLPGFVVGHTRLMVTAIRSTLKALPCGGRALLVSHQPMIDLARAHFTGGDPYEQVLEKGEIYRMKFSDEGAFESVEHLQ